MFSGSSELRVTDFDVFVKKKLIFKCNYLDNGENDNRLLDGIIRKLKRFPSTSTSTFQKFTALSLTVPLQALFIGLSLAVKGLLFSSKY